MVGRSNGPIVLNVAEKPSVARALAGVFNRMPQSRDGGMRRDAHQIFTHENVCFPLIFSQGTGQDARNQPNAPNAPHTMITTSVRGHLASIDFGPEYGWSRVDPMQLFDANIETNYSEDMKPLQAMLTRLSKTANAVILWLDCDREGEAIGDEVQTVCLDANRRLQTKIYRAKFSTVLDGEIQRALNTLGRLNDWFVQAVQARSQIDLRIGAAFTRFQTMRLQKKFQLSEKVISYGPCQFPTLGFVVERWARIETFRAEDFWYLDLTLKRPTDNNTNADAPSQPSNHNTDRPITFTWKRNRLYDRDFALNFYESCLDVGTCVVTQLSGRPKNKWRPVPLATVELQKRASRYLRIGSDALMSAAESLYNEGYISYPRTETERFRDEFQHRPLLQDFANAGGEFGAYANRLLNGDFQNPRAGPNDDQAHPPITPCKVVDPNSIGDPAQRGVYTLVVKHYLACCSRDAMGKETSISVKIASEEFTAKGLMILEKNWLEIYMPWERWSTGQGELPRLQVGSRVTPHSLLMKEGTTSAPQPLSEVELISLMDRNGIGTDATIAQHISTIMNREYATKDANLRFLPTPLGIALVEGYNSMGYQLNKPELRREMEHECNLVANQQKTKDDIVGPILNKMRECYERAAAEAQKLDDAVAKRFPRIGTGNDSVVVQASFSQCGICQNAMALKQARTTGGNNRQPKKLLFCNNCQEGYPLPRGRPEPKTEQDSGGPAFKCPICNFQVIKMCRGDGYEGNGHTVCPKCFNDPPADHGGTGGGSFRCFNCTHQTCSLSGGTQGGDIEVFACPFCREHNRNGKVCLKKTPRGYALGCSNYMSQSRCTYSIWMPRESKEISVADGNVCQQCTVTRGGGPVRKLSFVWKPGSVPPHLGRDCTACILCDASFRQDMDVSLPQLGQVRTNNLRQGGQIQAGGNRTTTTGGGWQNNHFQGNNNNNLRQGGQIQAGSNRTTTTGGGRQNNNFQGNNNNNLRQGGQIQAGSNRTTTTGGGWQNNNFQGNNNNNNQNDGNNTGNTRGQGGVSFGNNNSNNRRNTGRGGTGRSSSDRDRGGNAGGNAGGRGGNVVCFRCNQPGHYANACTNS